MPEIGPDEIQRLSEALKPLIGVQLELLKIPREVLRAFEPSQIGTIVGTLMDACIPQLSLIFPDAETFRELGLTKAGGILGDREGYPDFVHESGLRAELKLLYVDPVGVEMKKPPTPREPSARITQKVTVKNVDPTHDTLLVVAYQLRAYESEPDLFSPTVIDYRVFSMIECVRARDARLAKSGKWMGDYETPVILSEIGKAKSKVSEPLEDGVYGRKADEGHDWNEDTNFGKLARIPYKPLEEFLAEHNAH